MKNKFLISLLIAITVPILIIFTFAGPAIVWAALRWLAIIFLVTFFLFYFLGSTFKETIAKIGFSFEAGLTITTYILKFIVVFNLLFLILGGLITLLFLRGYLNENWSFAGFFTVENLRIVPALILATVVAYAASSQVLKQSKIGYILALLVSIPYILLLVGIFPVWFLLTYRLQYFAKVPNNLAG